VCDFAALDLVSSILCEAIAWEQRLQNDLLYVEYGVKLNQSIL